jgi:hypothetical protein
LRLATLPRSADIKPTAFAPPRDWSSAGIDSSARTKSGPSRISGACRASAHEAVLHSAASLQGLCPFAGWGRRLGFLRCHGALALLGLAFLGRSPPLPLGFSGKLALPRRRMQTAPRTAPELLGPRPRYPHFASPLGHFRNATRTGSVPCASEFQRARQLADLFRGCRPLQGFCPRPEP